MSDADSPLLEVTDLRVEFRSGREIVRAVTGGDYPAPQSHCAFMTAVPGL